MFDGSLRGKSDPQLVMAYFIACCDECGVCDHHFKAISDATGLSIERVVAAIEYLESPDPESRSPDEEGRRIANLDAHREWGWRLVNHWKYRDQQPVSLEDFQAKNRERQRRYKARKRESNVVTLSDVTSASASVGTREEEVQEGKPSCNGLSQPPTQAEFKAYCDVQGVPEDQAKSCYCWYEARHWMDRNGHVMKWKPLVVLWMTRSREEQRQKDREKSSRF